MKAWSLRAKLMLLIGLAILPLALLECHRTRMARTRVEVRVGGEALRLARLAAGHQRTILESARQLLMTLTEVDCIRTGKEREVCLAFLRKLQQTNPLYANIGAMDRHGAVYAAAGEVNGPAGFGDEPFFQQVRKTREWRVLDARVARRFSSVPSLVLAYPITLDDGAFGGAVFVAINLEWGEAYDVNLALPPDSVMATVDREARILSHFPDPERWVGRQVENPGVMEAVLTAGEKGGWISVRDAGQDRVYGVVPLRISGNSPVYVCVGLNREGAFAPYLQALRRQLVWVALIAGSALTGAWLLGSLFMVRPARHLVAVARAVAEGNSTSRSRLGRGAGEFYEIGTALNHMADAAEQRVTELEAVQAELQAAHDELEERVEQRTAELTRARERLTDAVETLDAGFVLFDAEGKLRACNEPFRRIFGNCREVIVPGVTFEEILRAFLRKGGKIEGVDDMKRWIATRLAYFNEAKGAPILAKINGRWFLTSDHRMRDGGTVSLRTDVTERTEAHEELEKVAEELRRSNAELEQFAYVVSHDLQEPLRMVASYTELLEKRYSDRMDEDAREFIRYAADGARRMQQFIDDLLRYSRVSKRTRPFQKVAMDDVADAALENLRYSREEKHAEVVVEPLPTVMGDRMQLVQLFQNLISNAVKFAGPEPLKVEIKAAREDGIWRFSVSDNGLGFSEEAADRVFDIFQRLHVGEAEAEGSGIGLAICKKIVERHGGRIWVKSRPGEGATFYFTLPIVAEASGKAAGTDFEGNVSK